jgi:protein phosphatase
MHAISTAPRAAAGSITVELTAHDRPLLLRVGHSSRPAAGKSNEDCYGIVTPASEPTAAARGSMIAIADGVSGGGVGRFASEVTVTTLLRDFYATPQHWSVSLAVDRVLRPINDWLEVANCRHPELQGAVSTLSLLLFTGGRYHLVHVGDTRVYRRRGAAFRQLTRDHTWPRRDMRHVLKRAVGLDTHLVADYADGELHAGDTFLMASDGVWEVLGEDRLRELVQGGGDPQAIAEGLTDRSLSSQARYMGRNDATAIVVAVESTALLVG